MLKLDSEPNEENFEDNEETNDEEVKDSNVKGSATVAFLGRNAVVRDYRKSEQADAFDESEPNQIDQQTANENEAVEQS